jgi:hypothetical protein
LVPMLILSHKSITGLKKIIFPILKIQWPRWRSKSSSAIHIVKNL